MGLIYESLGQRVSGNGSQIFRRGRYTYLLNNYFLEKKSDYDMI